MNEQILKAVREQTQLLLYINTKPILKKQLYEYERAKLIGMLEILDILGIDRTEFNWIL